MKMLPPTTRFFPSAEPSERSLCTAHPTSLRIFLLFCFNIGSVRRRRFAVLFAHLPLTSVASTILISLFEIMHLPRALARGQQSPKKLWGFSPTLG